MGLREKIVTLVAALGISMGALSSSIAEQPKKYSLTAETEQILTLQLSFMVPQEIASQKLPVEVPYRQTQTLKYAVGFLLNSILYRQHECTVFSSWRTPLQGIYDPITQEQDMTLGQSYGSAGIEAKMGTVTILGKQDVMLPTPENKGKRSTLRSTLALQKPVAAVTPRLSVAYQTGDTDTIEGMFEQRFSHQYGCFGIREQLLWRDRTLKKKNVYAAGFFLDSRIPTAHGNMTINLVSQLHYDGTLYNGVQLGWRF